jgi:hypothetical protein
MERARQLGEFSSDRLTPFLRAVMTSATVVKIRKSTASPRSLLGQNLFTVMFETSLFLILAMRITSGSVLLLFCSFWPAPNSPDGCNQEGWKVGVVSVLHLMVLPYIALDIMKALFNRV